MRGQTYTLSLLARYSHPVLFNILISINTALERTPYRLMLGISQSTTHIEEALAAARKLLQSPARPEARVCWTDFIALEVISVATELSRRIPDDLAILGHDNTHHCDFAQNSLTSVDQSRELLGLKSAYLLIERIQGPRHSQS
jgi:LacI family transcriptional regulator